MRSCGWQKENKLKKYLPDLLYFVGCACTITGVASYSVPAAWIVAGVELIIAAYLYERANS
jgi:hypothetical protein